MTTTYRVASESERHESTIDALVRETCAEPSFVRDLYRKELAKLESTAKIRNYLHVLVQRNVRSALDDAPPRP